MNSRHGHQCSPTPVDGKQDKKTMSKEKKTSTESKSVIKENLSEVPLENSTTVIFEIVS